MDYLNSPLTNLKKKMNNLMSIIIRILYNQILYIIFQYMNTKKIIQNLTKKKYFKIIRLRNVTINFGGN